MRVVKFLVAVIAAVGATVRISEIITEEKIAQPLREQVGIIHDEEGYVMACPENFFGQLLCCFRCTSVWAGGFIVILYVLSEKLFEVFTYWLALSWAAIRLK